MVNKEELIKLTNFIEENTRATSISGINFIDPRNFANKIKLKQNHVIYGRRGAGKSSLLRELLKDEETEKRISIYTNIEDYKDISFPNILIKVLSVTFSELISRVGEEVSFFKFKTKRKKRKAKAELRNILKELESFIEKPDDFDENIKSKETDELTTKATGKAGPLSGEAGGKISLELEIAKTFNWNKLNKLKNSISKIKEVLKKIMKFESRPIFLLLDDFYFVDKLTQPFLIDYFHRLSKDTQLFLKLGTIKHRSKLYTQLDNEYIGAEINNDIYDIDLDYTLDRFNDLKRFMFLLIEEAVVGADAKIENCLDLLFSSSGFSQLCLASGGVPRDFLVLLNKLLANYVPEGNQRISKTEVTEVAISNYPNKLDSLKKDTANESETIEICLNHIKEFVFTSHKRNMFLVSNSDLNENPQIKQVLRELVDLRMLHLVEPNTSCAPSDGKRYSAYLLDLCLYDNSKPRNFTEIEPGLTDSKSRKDDVRSSPKLNILELEKMLELENNNLNLSYEYKK